MKKTVTTLSLAIVAMLTVSTSVCAQEESYAPVKGDMSTEVQFNPFSNNFRTFNLESLKFRYFISDKGAVRLNLGLKMNNETIKDNPVTNGKFDNVPDYTVINRSIEMNTKETQLRIGLGYEHHFMNYKRVDLYAGAELGYIGNFYSADKTIETTGSLKITTPGTTTYNLRDYTSTEKIEYKGMLPGGIDPTPGSFDNPFTGAKFNNASFYVGAFTGIDFYIYKGIYVGAELGIRFNSGKSIDNGTFTQSYTENLKAITNTGTTSTVVTTNTYWDYDSETGRQVGKTTNVTGTTTTETEINNANATHDYTSSFTKLEVYVEPALRIGWKF